MRKISVLGLVVASLVSVASVSQAQASAPQARQERHEARRMEGREGHGGLLRGIKLSDAEKARVKQIHEKYGSEAKSIRESLRPTMQEARTARQKGDSAAVKAAWSKTAGDREKLRALMDRERTEIRTALSAEHQTQFDANVKQFAQRRAEWEKNGKGGRAGGTGFRGHRGTNAS